jgi:hypothetical protein
MNRGADVTGTELESESDNLAAVAMASLETATTLLVELARERGKGEWIGQLKSSLRSQIACGVPDHISPEKQSSFVAAALATIDLVFERIVFASDVN